MCDRKGAIYEGRQRSMNPYKEEISKVTNPDKLAVNLDEAMEDADVFIGLSIGNVVSEAMVEKMADNPIVFCYGKSNS